MDNNFARTQLSEFGKHMNTVAITTVLSFIPGLGFITSIIALVFIFISIGDLKRLNYQLNDPRLEIFRSKYISSFIFTILAVILIVVGGVNLAVSFLLPTLGFYFTGYSFPIAIILMSVGFILLISAAVMEMRAWENLKLFFQQNKELIPDNIRHEIIDGCDNLRTGSLLFALGFLVITLLIGLIFKIIGYFKLARLNTLPYQKQPKAEPSSYQVQYQQQQFTQSSQPNAPIERAPEKVVEMSNFCPNCGAKLSRGGRYCPLCGSELN